jgi:predicted GIY-YIG superfamily endonuclease
MKKLICVLSEESGIEYVGVTNNLERRVREHRRSGHLSESGRAFFVCFVLDCGPLKLELRWINLIRSKGHALTNVHSRRKEIGDWTKLEQQQYDSLLRRMGN